MEFLFLVIRDSWGGGSLGVFYSINSCRLLSTAPVGGGLSCFYISPSLWILMSAPAYLPWWIKPKRKSNGIVNI